MDKRDNYISDPIRVRLLESQYDALWALAENRGKTLVDLIREGVDMVIANATEDIPALIKHYEEEFQPWPEDRPIEEHPAWISYQESLRLSRLERGDSTEVSDTSANHHKYLAEILEEEIERGKGVPRAS